MSASESAAIKRAAIRANYLIEPNSLLRSFVRKPLKSTSALQLRLTGLRVHCVERALLSLLLNSDIHQFVSIGAGLDSIGLELVAARAVRVFECDTHSVCDEKRQIIEQDANLSSILQRVGSQRFQLIPCDLSTPGDAARRLAERGFATNVPTLVLAEDVMQFVSPPAFESLLQWLGAMPQVALVVFAPTLVLGEVFANALSNDHSQRRAAVYLTHWSSPQSMHAVLSRHGFTSVLAASLLQLWNALPEDERRRVIGLEPFDEHEDMAAFAARHSVAIASRGLTLPPNVFLPVQPLARMAASFETNEVVYASSSNTRKQIERWGASLCVVERCIVVFGGYGGGGGAHARVSSISVATYSTTRDCWTWRPLSTTGVAPSPRMCHAAVSLTLNDGTPVAMIVGGRANASAALADVSVLHVGAARWLNVEVRGQQQLQARFRHTLTRVADSTAVAIGGRSGERVLDLAVVDVFTLGRQDVALSVHVEATTTQGQVPCARFAHASAFLPSLNSIAVLGGLDATERALPCHQLHLLELASWTWRTVELATAASPSFTMFGHTMHSSADGRLWVVGAADANERGRVRCIDTTEMRWLPLIYDFENPRFMLYQHCSALIDNRELLVVGGGFLCGSTQEHFNSFARLLVDLNDRFAEIDVAAAAATTSTVAAPAAVVGTNALPDGVRRIEIVDNVTTAQFESLVERKTPAIFRNSDFGRARELWTFEHLKAHGGTVDVSVHVCDSPFLDFQSRNYTFRTMSFGDLIDSVCNSGAKRGSEFLYLRSVGANPRKDVADVWSQWPTLCNDGQLRVPEPMMPLVEPNLFSSVFRVSSANVWVFMHYDVCDNILIGVRGRKRVVLFAPRDIDRLYVDGSTSRIVDIDGASAEQFPRFRKAYERRYEAILEEGDILYIPALWFHTTFTIGAPAVGVNVFWRDPLLPRELLSTRDLYGNVDPTPAAALLRELSTEEQGKSTKPPSLNALLRSLEHLPHYYRDFYGRKFVSELQKRLSLN